MKIVIAGAGIGGLTAAMCLCRAGFDVTVFEAVGELRPLGYKLRRITKVFISDRYLTALAAIAGTGPTR